jgi:bifunctional DNase/RNase
MEEEDSVVSMVEVTVARLGLDGASNSYVIILQEKGGSRLLPIWIGQPEAESIAMHMSNVRRERPLTHDLCRNIIVALGGTLNRVQITKVQQNTYYAELHVLRGEQTVTIDARPSDSIAVALRLEAPIFAPDALLMTVADDEVSEIDSEADTSAGFSVPEAPEGGRSSGELSAEQLKAYLENLRPEDFGKFTP